jgi:phosphate starvation-inducible PhoH-like protein
LPRGKESGLRHAMRVLGQVPEIAFVSFGAQDVVRHPLVQTIVAAYALAEADSGAKEPE